MKKFALTGMVAIMAVSPSFAVPTNTSATFPQNGYMLEDYTYTNAATATNMDGVYENSVNADADYGDCPANSWCDASGQHACSTAGDGSYTLSAIGSTANTACYKSCTVANANIAHAVVVSGNDYYGTGTDTCSAALCEDGYHTQSFDLETEIGTSTSTTNNSAYINISGGTATSYGLTESGTFAVEYDGKGILKGRARCSYQSGTSSNSDPDAITKASTLSDSTGTYCWCLVDEYTPVGGSPMSLTGPWVYRNDMGTEDDCEGPYAMNCAWQCRGGFLAANTYRTAVLRSRDPLQTICAANTITINWSNASAADIAANEAGTVTYGGDIRTPRAAQIIPGKVFIGWTFSAPEPELAPGPAQ